MIRNYNSLGSGRDTWLKNDVGDLVGSPPGSSRSARTTWLAFVFLMLSIFSGQQSLAQVTIPAGNPAGSLSNYPYSAFYGYHGTDAIYLASEIGTTGTISSISFYLESVTAPAAVPIVISMQTTTATTLPTSGRSFATLSAAATQVYSGTLAASSFVAGGWVTVNLTTPFVYSGNNLEVFIASSFGGSGGESTATNKQFRWSATSASRCITWQRDTNPALQNAQATNQTSIPNVRFGGLTVACAQPTALTSAFTSATTANLGWTAPSPAPSGNYEYAVTTSATPPASGTPTSATSVVANSLLPATTYYLHVRSNCGSALFSSWATRSFTTSYCTPAPSSVDGTGITNVSFGSVNNTTVAETGNYGNYSAQASSHGQGTTVNVNITYKTGYTYDTKIWVDFNDDYDFDDLGEEVYVGVSLATNPTTLAASFIVPAGASLGNHRMRIGGLDVGPPTPCYTGTFGTYEDYTLTVVAPPACNTPNGVTATITSSTTANLSWTAAAGSPSGGYQYEVRASGAAGSGATGLGASGSTLAGVVTATASGLTPNTTYTAYVRSNCDGSGFSTWVASQSFYTGACVPTGTNGSYYTTSVVTTGGTTNINRTSVAEANAYGNFFGSQSVSQFPTGVIGLTINANTTSNNFAVWIDWNNDLDFNDVGETVVSTGYISSYSGNITVPAGQALGAYRMRIASAFFNALTPCGPNGSGEYEDYTFNVITAPTCLKPTALTVIGYTSTTANISWTAPVSSTPIGYQYEVRTSGAAGSGATGLTVSGSTVSPTVSATVTGLTANTNYSIYVRSDCGAGDFSAWTDATPIFTGYCVPAGTVSSYWITNFSTSNAVGNVNNSSVGGAGGYTNYSSTIGVSAYPGQVINTAISTNTATHYFYVWVDWNNDLDFADAGETITATTTYASALASTLTVPAGQALGTYRMRIANSELGVTTACGPNAYGEYEDYAFNVVAAPTCYAPTGLVTSGITQTSGNFSWTAPALGTPAGYQWEVRISGAAGSGATGLTASGSTAAGITNASATGLTANTTYSVYVRTFCGGTDYSAWSSPATLFTGYCIPTGSTTYYITNVTTTGGTTNINNTSTASANGYGNFSAQSASQYPGSSLGITATASAADDEYFVWVDWNNDLDFLDAGELVINNTSYAPSLSGSIAIPVGQAIGSYRMRIANSYIGDVTSCGPSTYGEFEDYTINVVPVPPTITSFSPVSVCSYNLPVTVTITGTSLSGVTSVALGSLTLTPSNVSATSLQVTIPATAVVSDSGVFTVTAPNGVRSSATAFNIYAAPTVTPINGAAEVCMPNTLSLTNNTGSGVWASLNTDIATVDQTTGVVTGVSAGSATITYTVTTNGCSTVVSKTIDVRMPVAIVDQPVNVTVVTGNNSSFSVNASGTGLSYQWEYSDDGGDTFYTATDDGTFSGTMTNTLQIAMTPGDLNGYIFQVIVSGTSPCNPVTSSTASLAVGSTGIDQNPSDVALCTGGTASFTVVASGDVDGFIWKEDRGSGPVVVSAGTVGAITYSIATDLAGKTSTLTVSGLTTSSDGWQYFATVDGPANDPNSTVANLSIKTGPAIATPASNLTVCRGVSSNVYSITTSGNVTGIQWQYGTSASGPWTDLAALPTGTTYVVNNAANFSTSTLTVNATAALVNGVYYYHPVLTGVAPCAVFDSPTAVYSLTVQSPVLVVSQSAPGNCGGSGVTLMASGAVSYQWSPATGLSATNTATVTATPSVSTVYTVVGTDANGCTTSATVTVGAGSPVFVTASASASTVCEGTPVTLSAVSTVGTVGNYSFAVSNQAYTPITGTAFSINGSSGSADDGYSTLQNIGFTFNMGGTNFTQFSVGSNGYVRLGALPSSTTNYTAISGSDSNLIAFNNRDLNNAGAVYSSSLTGSAGSRILKIQAANFYRWDSAGQTGNAQIWLYEGSGKIEIRYGAYAANWGSGTPQIGIKGASTAATNVKAISATTWASITSASASTNNGATVTQATTNQVAPGTVFAFSPQYAQATSFVWTSSPNDPSLVNTTSANPVVSPPLANTTYTYTVVASSSQGCSSTATVQVTTQSGALITTQPVALTTCQGAAASLSVVATGPGLTYQWYQNGAVVAGNATATTATLNFTAGVPANSGNYYVVVTPLCGAAATSNTVALLVNPTPTVVKPTSQTYCAGSVAPVTNLVGTPSNVTYNINGGTTGLGNLTGVTAIPSFTPTASGTITVTPVANGCTGTASTYAITVNPLPAVTVSATTPLCAGANLSLTATVPALTGYVINPSSGVAFIDISTTGTSVGTVSDDSEHNVTIPSFVFNTTTYTTGRIGNNGAFAFGATAGDINYTNVTLPAPLGFNGTGILSDVAGATLTALCPLWSDLLPSTTLTTSIRTQTVGNKYIIQWTNEDILGATGDSVTFQIQLNLTTGQIIYVYQDINPGTGPNDSGSKATVGVNLSATSAVLYSFKTASLANGQSITFTPSSYSFAWTGPNGFTSNVQNPTITGATAAASGVYNLTVTNVATGCSGSASTVNVTVSPTSVGGTVASSKTVCSGSTSGALTLSGQTGTVLRWESSVNGGSTWNPISGTAGLTTYTSGPLSVTTQFRAVVQSGTCTDAASAPAIITVNVVSFTSATSAPVCSGTEAIVTINGLVPNSTTTVNYTANPGGATSVNLTADAAGSATFNVLVTGAGQSITVTSIVRTDVTPSCPITPTSGNVVNFVLSSNCSTVQAAQCGTTLAQIDSYVYANLVGSASAYRWRVTTLTGSTAGQVQFANTILRNLKLTSLAVYAFDTQYKVEVSASVGGTYAPYGTPCTVSTPATQTQLVSCGVANYTVANLADAVYANLVPFAAGYKFRITDPSNPTNTQELFRATREFRFSLITAFTVQYNKTYNVQVAIRNTDGSYLPYVSTCEVRTPIFPTTSLQQAQCDDYVVPSLSTVLYADSYPNAIGYAFLLKGPGLPAAGVEVVRNLRTVRLDEFPTLVAGQTYNMRVRLIFDNADPAGSYGKNCSIIAPGAARQEVSELKAKFSAVAYPNPFAENFNIDVTTSTEASVTVRVYDMTGRLLEEHVNQVSQMESLKVGDRYPSGVYNVIVTQGDNAKTLRVIKR